jgi:hypothetical protein
MGKEDVVQGELIDPPLIIRERETIFESLKITMAPNPIAIFEPVVGRT